MTFLVQVLRDYVFPIPLRQNAQDYAKKWIEAPAFKENAERIDEIANRLPLETRERLYSHVKDQMALESGRADSIVSRTQALLASQTFLGALLAFGIAAFSNSNLFVGWFAYVTAGASLYIVGQIVLLTLNALRAIKGIDYPRVGTSDLIKWLPEGEKAFIGRISLIHLRHYKLAVISNSWRFAHLSNAQRCLRNIVLAVSSLVIWVFVVSIAAPKDEQPKDAPRAVPAANLYRPQ